MLLVQIQLSTGLQQFLKRNFKEKIMKNIVRNFDNQFVSEETMKIAKDNAIQMQQLTALTESAISVRNAELAETLRTEIINAQQGV